jgi:hypothetical protein
MHAYKFNQKELYTYTKKKNIKDKQIASRLKRFTMQKPSGMPMQAASSSNTIISMGMYISRGICWYICTLALAAQYGRVISI